MHSFLTFLNLQSKMEMLLWYLLFLFPPTDEQLHHIMLNFLKFYSRKKQLAMYIAIK